MMTKAQSLQCDPIVITGMGAVCGLGVGVDIIWQRLVAGETAIRRLRQPWAQDLSIQIGASVPSINEDSYGFDPDAFLTKKQQRTQSRFIHFALCATVEALAQADWHPNADHAKQRTATIIGSSIGGIDSIDKMLGDFSQRGERGISPFAIPSFLLNSASAAVSIAHGFQGTIKSPATTCTAGAQAIIDAAALLKQGDADVVVCGASEACIHPAILAAFAQSGAATKNYNDSPTHASRPFDKDRSGFVLGEGAAILVLERQSHALARGANVLAKFLGASMTSEAFHPTSCTHQGLGLQRTMHTSLLDANITADQIDLINAHGTSTKLGDKAEAHAIAAIFGKSDNQRSPSVTSTKSATGHLLGAAGALETIFSIKSLETQTIPSIASLGNIDTDISKLNYATTTIQKPIRNILSNSAGFGGVNASLVFARAQD